MLHDSMNRSSNKILNGLKRIALVTVFVGLLMVIIPTLSPSIQAVGMRIYVAPSGNDNNSGTIDQPLKTIQAAVDRAKPGDTVYIRDGTYVEAVSITQSGNSENLITVKAYPGEKPVIDGRAGVDCLNCGLPDATLARTDSKTGRAFNWAPLVGIQGDYIILEGFVVKRSIGRGIVVWRNDSKLSGVTLKNNQILDSRNAGILLEGNTENVLIENNVIWHSGSYAPWVDGRSASELDWPGALSVKGGNYVTVRENTIFENWAEGILIDTNSGNSKNIIVEDNVVYDNFALQIYIHRVENMTVQRNLTYHTNDPDWRRGDNPSHCIVVNNEVFDGNNIITNNIDIVNNIAAGCQQNFAVWGNEGQELSSENFLVAHNAFVNAVTNNPDNKAQGINFANNDYRNFKFENNIIYQGITTNGHEVGSADLGVSYANNLWYPHLPENGEGSGPGDIVGQDPQFEDPQAYELPENWSQKPDLNWFKIKSNSPAIDQSVISQPFLTTTEILFDLFWGIRDPNPDIGVHEYGSTSPRGLICQILGHDLALEPVLIIQLLDRTHHCSAYRRYLSG